LHHWLRQLTQHPVLSMIMALMRNDTERMGWISRWRMRRINKFVSGSALGY